MGKGLIRNYYIYDMIQDNLKKAGMVESPLKLQLFPVTVAV